MAKSRRPQRPSQLSDPPPVSSSLPPAKPSRAGKTRREARRAFVEGPNYLLRRGYDAAQMESFASRDGEANAELHRLAADFAEAEDVVSRARELARVDVAKMSLIAIRILRDALKGPVYVRSPETGEVVLGQRGPLVAEPGPTSQQTALAQSVLSMIGVSPEVRVTSGRDATLNPTSRFVAAKVRSPVPSNIIPDPAATYSAQAVAREKVRNAFERFVISVAAARKEGDGEKTT